MRRFFYLMIILLIYACNKEPIKDSTLLTDSVSVTRYYPNEIFNEKNLKLYGKWQFYYIYDDAGIIMGPGKIAPNYDYLEVKKYGIYGKIKNNKIIETGKIVVIHQDNSQFEIELIPEQMDNPVSESWYNVYFNGNDSVKFYDATIGCGYLYNAFNKQK